MGTGEGLRQRNPLRTNRTGGHRGPAIQQERRSGHREGYHSLCIAHPFGAQTAADQREVAGPARRGSDPTTPLFGMWRRTHEGGLSHGRVNHCASLRLPGEPKISDSAMLVPRQRTAADLLWELARLESQERTAQYSASSVNKEVQTALLGGPRFLPP
jgi:hypothetical protein